MKKITINLVVGLVLLFSLRTMGQANDECINATPLNCGDVITGEVTNLATGGSPTSCIGTIGNDLWYSFAGDGQIITLTATATVEEPQVEVFASTDGTCAGFASASCIASAGTGAATVSVSFVSVIGTVYYIHVGNWINGDPGVTYDLAVTCATAPTPPANDECSGAEALTVNPDALCTSVTPGTVAAATASAVDSAACTGTEDDDVWYSFIANESAHIISFSNFTGSTTAVSSSVWSGDCNSLVLVPGSCSAVNSRVVSGLTVGQTYYVRVYTAVATIGQTTTFDICIGTPPPPPTNDDCGGAISLTVNPDASCTVIQSGTVQSATASAVDTAACGGTEDDDVWYSFVAEGTVQKITLSNVAGSVTDLYHSLWTGDCNSLTLVPNSCSDANTSTPSGLVVGQTYYLRVYTFTGTTGQTTTFDICIGTPPPPPANDECSNAVVLNCGDVLTGQVTDSATGGSGTSCVGTIGNDIWYSYVGDGQIVTLTATATVEEPQVEVFASTDGTCTGFTPGTCIASGGAGNASVSVTFVSVIGTTYYVHVGNWINNDPGVTFDLAVTCSAPPTPPANDDCSGAEALTVNADATCAVVTSGTVSGATQSAVDTAACGGTEDDDVWYSFVAASSSHIISLNNVAGSVTDVFHSLWSGDCSSLTLVPNSCSDANTSTPGGLVVGQTYYVRVYTFTGIALQNTTFDICIGTPPPPPANDECNGAISLTVNPDDSCTSFEAGTVQSATASPVDGASCGGTEDDDVWYSFVASDALQTIRFNNVAGSSTGLSSSVWSGDCSALTLVAGSCSGANLRTVTGLTAGETYYVRVYTTTATTGQNTTFEICIGTPPPPPANDDCSGAIELTAGGNFATSAMVGSNISATSTVGLPVFICQTNRTNEVWYTCTVPASGTLTIETQAAPGTLMTDSVISIYTGTCGSLVEVGCDDDTGVGNFSLEPLTGLTPGATLYIGVWRFGATADGEFQISAYDASLLSNTTFESGNFQSYPNPVKDVLNLSYDKEISTVAVYNLLGQEVMTRKINSNQSKVDMSVLSAGTYIVKVTAENQVNTIKVLKE